MKRYFTIGRDLQSDIVLNDDSDVVSRRHAVLEVGRNGKYFITDQSRNGTYVNGIRISQGEKVPVTREDEISFAHVQNLDWSLVPKDRTLLVALLSSVGAAAVAALLVFGIVRIAGSKADAGKETVETVIPGAVGTVPEAGAEAGKEAPKVVDGDKAATVEKEKEAPKPRVVKPKKEKPKEEPETPKVVPDAIY